MVEGELKKQTLYPFIVRGQIKFVKRTKAEHTIDSAKKEFPNYKELLKKYGWETPSEYSIAVDKWALKWFGT